MPLAAIASVVGIASGINSLTSGGASGAVTQAADPFSAYRGNLASMYAGALQPGASANIQSMPGFTQFNTGVLQPAMQASQRAAASAGQLYSGGEQQALQQTGQKGYYGFMTDYLNRLAQGSGAANNPATAVGMGLGQQQAGYQALAQGVGGLAGQFGGSVAGTGAQYSAGPIGGASLDASFDQYATTNYSGGGPIGFAP